MIAETGAVYNTDLPILPGDATEYEIKSAYMNEMFNVDNPGLNMPTLPATFPELKMIIWFN